MPFNCSSPEYLSHHRTPQNRVSLVSQASPAHMNSPLSGIGSILGSARFFVNLGIQNYISKMLNGNACMQ